MSFSSFFSKQARQPTGLFGRLVTSIIFDQGNTYLNSLVKQTMTVNADNHVLEIGFGTGKLIKKMAQHIDQGLIEGIDFSHTMVAIAQRKLKKYVKKGKVKISHGNFDEASFDKESFAKICSVNTLYF